jgi:hypothetical protein
MSQDDRTLPLGIPLGRLLPLTESDVDTEPIPMPPPTPSAGLPTKQSALVAVKAAETCGPCGSALSVDWVGRTDALQVIRDWRAGHRCYPPSPDAAGVKVGHIERVGFAPE